MAKPKTEKLEAVEPTPAVPLSELLGNPAARDLLDRGVREGRLPHALLIVGPRGVGKTTVARSVAAQNFCATRDACGRCAPCHAWAHSNQAGLVEVAVESGKSWVSIAQIKELGRVLSLGAPTDRGRIVLIEDADRMTAPAQDALLKTLEEPPPGNVLILMAERLGAVFPTLRSRCQRFALAPLEDSDLAKVAERLGVRSSVPLSLAMGCPGRLGELSDPQVQELRKGVLWILESPRGPEDAARWAYVLHRGLAPKPETDLLRARARLLWSILGSFLRDVIVLRECGGDSTIPTTAGTSVRNTDLVHRLTAVAQRQDLGDPVEVLEALSRSRLRIDGAVDPVLSLYGVLSSGGNEDVEASGLVAALVQDLG